MYKLVGEDDDMFMMRHPDGKHFSVAKKSIGKHLHEKIRGYADGGVVIDKSKGLAGIKEFLDANSDILPPPTDSPVTKAIMGDRNPAEDQINVYGKDFNSPSYSVPASLDRNVGGAPSTFLPKAQEGDLLMQGVSGQPAQGIGGQAVPMQSMENLGAGGQDISAQLAGNAPQLDYSSFQSVEQAPLDVVGTAPEWPEPKQPSIMDQMSEAQRPIKEAVGEYSQAASDVGTEQSQAYDKMNQGMADLNTNYTKAFNTLNNDFNQAAKDYADSKVDQFKLWHDASTGSKIGGIVAIMLGGLSQGLTGKDNPATGMLDKMIERDIQNQKIQIGKKHNLLSMNLQRFNNLNAATAATKAMMIAQAEAKIKGAGTKLLGPQAKMQGAAMLTNLEMQRLALTRQVAMLDAVDKVAGGGGKVSPSMARMLGIENQLVDTPEIKWSTGDVTKTSGMARTKEDAAKVKEVSQSALSFKNALDQAREFEKQHQGLLKGTWGSNKLGVSSDLAKQAETLKNNLKAAAVEFGDRTGNAGYKAMADSIPSIGTVFGGDAVNSLNRIEQKLMSDTEAAYKARMY